MNSSNQNTVPGSARQRARSRTGEALERGYLYLKPEAWAALHVLARAANLSASQFIASIIPADHGTSKIKDQPNAKAAIRTN
jgi:hypothetical protein